MLRRGCGDGGDSPAVSALDPSISSWATLTLDSTQGKYCKYSWNFLNTLSLPR